VSTGHSVIDVLRNHAADLAPSASADRSAGYGPALVRLSERFPHAHLAKIHETHTISGHVAEEIGFPDWVSRELAAQAAKLDEDNALGQLGDWCGKGKPIRKTIRRNGRSS